MDLDSVLEKNIRLLYGASPTLICILDAKGIIMDINKSTLEHFGYSKEDMVGRSCFDFIAPDYKKTAMDRFNEMKGKDTDTALEILLVKKDNTTFYGLCKGAALYDKDGNFAEYIVTIQDASILKEALRKIEDTKSTMTLQYDELKKTHDLITLTEQKYRNLYETSPDLLRSIDSNGTIIDCNERYAKRLGYTKEEVLGRSLYEHTAQKSLEKLKNMMIEWQKVGTISNEEMWLKRKDGSIFPTLLSGTNLYDERGNITGRTVSLRDITEIYDARRELEKAHKKILQQLDELKVLDLKKDEFLTMLTHELKTPLVPIKGYADLLLSEEFGTITPTQREKINIIKSNTDAMLKLILDLLDVQKIELGKLKMNIEQHNVNEIIKETIDSVIPLVESHRIKLISEVGSEPVLCMCDKVRIEQVLINLISNAVDFCPKENGKITINLKKNQEAHITIKDNGVGISKANLDKIFVRFYQIDTSSTREHSGTGLGLAICKGIVENHGGKIWAESDGPEKGCTMNIVLPLTSS